MTTERRSSSGLMPWSNRREEDGCNRFQNCVGFVDGRKQHFYRPVLGELQNERHSGHQEQFCHSILLWTEANRVIIRMDFSLDRAEPDRGLYNLAGPYRLPTSYFSYIEAVNAGTGFEGRRARAAYPFKRTHFHTYIHCRKMNRISPKLQIRNEKSVRLISKRFRLLLGQWSIEDA